MTALSDLNALQASIAEAVLGQDQVIRQILLGLLANGHLLLESLPGLAKTRTVKALAKHLDAKMSRIQFTPDLLPSDITGAEVLHQVDGQERDPLPARAAVRQPDPRRRDQPRPGQSPGGAARSHGRTADHRGRQQPCLAGPVHRGRHAKPD
jgi:MoxR-like ATPase